MGERLLHRADRQGNDAFEVAAELIRIGIGAMQVLPHPGGQEACSLMVLVKRGQIRSPPFCFDEIHGIAP